MNPESIQAFSAYTYKPLIFLNLNVRAILSNNSTLKLQSFINLFQETQASITALTETRLAKPHKHFLNTNLIL